MDIIRNLYYNETNSVGVWEDPGKEMRCRMEEFVYILSYFYLYCIIGWCFESTYVSIVTKKLTNRGFMHGPWLPIYGCGALVMLAAAWPFKGNFPMMFLVGMLGATLLEYVTGALMERMFHVRYWDYSHKKWNVKGYICLESSLTWGAFTILLVQFIHAPVSSWLHGISYAWLTGVVAVVTIVFMIDLISSVKTALNVKHLLQYLELAVKEAEEVQKKINQTLEEYKAGAGETLNSLEETVNRLRSNTKMKYEDLKKDITAQIKPELFENLQNVMDMENRVQAAKELASKYRKKLEEATTSIKKHNPTATSSRLRELIKRDNDRKKG